MTCFIVLKDALHCMGSYSYNYTFDLQFMITNRETVRFCLLKHKLKIKSVRVKCTNGFEQGSITPGI